MGGHLSDLIYFYLCLPTCLEFKMDDYGLPEKVSTLKLEFNFNVLPKPFILRLKIRRTFTKITLIYFHWEKKSTLSFLPPIRASWYTSNYLGNLGKDILGNKHICLESFIYFYDLDLNIAVTLYNCSHFFYSLFKFN